LIYLDHNATTPLDPQVLEAMMPYLTMHFGNPSSDHAAGRHAAEAVRKSRQRIADLFGCDRREVIFTSGGSEANTLAFQGTLTSGQFEGKHIVIGGAEHPSVTAAAMAMKDHGYEVTLAPITEFGEVTAKAIEDSLRKDTVLVSVMHGQNEVGTVNNLEEIGEVLGFRRIAFHTDAAQSVGKQPTTFPFMGTQLMTVAPHKFYGPRGIGCLISALPIKLKPQILGGGQEGGRRAGTENVAAIVGFARALELCSGSRLVDQGESLTALRDYFHLRLSEELNGVLLNGHIKYRLPTTLNVSFTGILGAALIKNVEKVLFGTGSACHEGEGAPSATLAAMGIDRARALASVRISIGRSNTVEQIDEAIDDIVKAVKALRVDKGIDEGKLGESHKPECPRCARPLKVISTSGGMLMACEAYDVDCKHLLPLPGTRAPE
jgi:cysteine desulfurase